MPSLARHLIKLSPGFGPGLFGEHLPRAHDYEPTREAAMAAFAKSWRRS
jgi:hypothetical protein